MRRFPLVYWAYARKPDGRIYRVLVTVEAPGAATRSEWTDHVYASERAAARDVERHNCKVTT